MAECRLMLPALTIFIATLVLVIWQPRKLGIGWSALLGAAVALLAGVVTWADIGVVWHIVWDATFTFVALICCRRSKIDPLLKVVPIQI